MRRMLSTWVSVASVAALLLLLYALVLALIAWRQESLLFYPQVLPATHRISNETDVHDLWTDVPGARLHALHLRRPAPDGLVFFLHGNAGSLDSWFVDLDLYRRANVDLVMLDYRGYGKSSGSITSEAQLMADVRAVWQQVAQHYSPKAGQADEADRASRAGRAGKAGLRRIFVGRSLGSGLAAMLAAEVQPEATILVSPYFSMRALAAEHYPWVPGALLRYPLRTDQALPRVSGNVLLVHGERDTVIPASHTARLQALVPQAAVSIIEGAGHNDLQSFPAYRQQLLQLLRR
ncbi:MAG: alpha/beta hydrolase [Rubrivivax sp.]|nr:alpha/beta hydrolase [Rubrivivax sp.]